MSKVTIGKNTKIVGLFDISVSKADDTIFISNKKISEPGAVNSFALYADEEGKIKPAGFDLIFDADKKQLTAPIISADKLVSIDIFSNNLTSSNIETNSITSSSIVVDTLTINNYIDINSLSINGIYTQFLHFLDNDNDVFAKMHYDDVSGSGKLAILTKKQNGSDGCVLTIDENQRLKIEDGILNLKTKRVIKSSIGSPGDLEGDVFIIGDYIYYCKKHYNGISKIWVRIKFTETNW